MISCELIAIKLMFFTISSSKYDNYNEISVEILQKYDNLTGSVRASSKHEHDQFNLVIYMKDTILLTTWISL